MEQQDLFENPKKDPANLDFYRKEDPTQNGKKLPKVKVIGFRQNTIQPPSRYNTLSEDYWKDQNNATPRGPGTKE